jgi:tetratricopeptide (TPR) repeat protein
MTGLEWSWLLRPGQAGDGILERLQQAPAEEAERLLRELRNTADYAGVDGVNLLAVGLAVAGRPEQAVEVLRAHVAENPEDTMAWLNLAQAELQSEPVGRVGAILEAAVAGAVDPGLRELAEQRRAEFERADREASQNRELLEHQAAALRERVTLGLARPGDRNRLTRILMGLAAAADADVTAEQVLEAARDAHWEAPEDPTALELLAASLLNAGDRDEFGRILRELERRVPHSPVLDLMREHGPDHEARVRAWQQRSREVVRRAWTGDLEALAELRVLARRFPRNHEYRVGLMMAAVGRKDYAKGRAIADGLAGEAEVPHETHFHLGQFYAFAGDLEKSREHFALAWSTARTEADRRDVVLAMETVGVRFERG